MHTIIKFKNQERTNQHEIQNQRHPLSIYLHPRSVAAFHLWMVGRQPHCRAVLGGQRIHVGASEAALLPDASAHAGRAVLLPWKNASQLPLGAYPRNLVRHDFYCRSFLYTEWYPRNKLRLDQYCTIFCRRYLRPLRGKWCLPKWEGRKAHPFFRDFAPLNRGIFHLYGISATARHLPVNNFSISIVLFVHPPFHTHDHIMLQYLPGYGLPKELSFLSAFLCRKFDASLLPPVDPNHS